MEGPSLKSSAALAEKAGSGTFEPYKRPDAQKDRRQDNQCAAGEKDIEQPLGGPADDALVAPRRRAGMPLVNRGRMELGPVAFGSRSKKPCADANRGVERSTMSNFH